jgi:phosphoribosylformylglycinamidine cyclo-ligase
MPGLYQPGDYDLAGFSVGIADRDKIIDGSDVRVGDKIIGLASSGLHSNGFSLVRKIIFEDQGLTVADKVEALGCTIGEELIKPTKIYVRSVLGVLNRYPINSLVHNTGGGFIDNIPRVLPKGCRAMIDKESWEKPPIFAFLQEKGAVPEAEMYRTFNMGIGMMAVVKEANAESIMQHFKAMGEETFLIGEVLAAKEGEPQVVINGLEGN